MGKDHGTRGSATHDENGQLFAVRDEEARAMSVANGDASALRNEALSVNPDKIANPELRASLIRVQAMLKGRSPEAAKPVLRKPPAKDNQPDFFVPGLYDISVKDGIGLMDIAVFRLAKSQTRKADIIRHELPNVTVEVSGGAYGMATVYDYDIILMMISHLADQTRLWRDGKGPKPSRIFRPHSTEIFKFRRVDGGGDDYKQLEASLTRLAGTTIRITRNQVGQKLDRRLGLFNLIESANVVSSTATGKVGAIELVIPEWLYEGVVSHANPEVLTISQDYFLIRQGLARFLYRLARKAAGRGVATYSLASIHERSGTTREFKKFVYDIRQIVAANDLPDYTLEVLAGKDGPLLKMSRREALIDDTAENRACETAANTTI